MRKRTKNSRMKRRDTKKPPVIEKPIKIEQICDEEKKQNILFDSLCQKHLNMILARTNYVKILLKIVSLKFNDELRVLEKIASYLGKFLIQMIDLSIKDNHNNSTELPLVLHPLKTIDEKRSLLIYDDLLCCFDNPINDKFKSYEAEYPVSCAISHHLLKFGSTIGWIFDPEKYCKNILEVCDLLSGYDDQIFTTSGTRTHPEFCRNMLKIFSQPHLPTKIEIYKCLFRNITKPFRMQIFGSAVFDISCANDLDFTDLNDHVTDYDLLVNSLSMFFSISTSTSNNYTKKSKSRDKILIITFKYYDSFVNNNHSDKITKWIGKLNYVPYRIYESMQKTIRCDYWEMGLVKSNCEYKYQTQLMHRADCPDIFDIQNSLDEKKLTPIVPKMSNHQPFGGPLGHCDLECKSHNFFNIIKHFRRYCQKIKIYEIVGHMPFINHIIFHTEDILMRQFISNGFPVTLGWLTAQYCDYVSSTDSCYMCGQPFVDGFFVKVINGKTYIHEKCFCRNVKNTKMQIILKNFVCYIDGDISYRNQ